MTIKDTVIKNEEITKTNLLLKSIIKYTITFIISLILASLLRNYVFSGSYVVGDSMHPTLQDSDVLVISKLPLYGEGTNLNRGYIVSIRDDVARRNYVKRIIGLPGDHVKIHEGKVYLNGEVLKEEYVETSDYTDTYEVYDIIVPEGEYYVLGDNRSTGASYDSRAFGTVKFEQILGVATLRYLPLKRISNL